MADEKQTSKATRARTVPDVVSPTSHEEQLREGQQVLADAQQRADEQRTPVPVPPPVVGAPADPAGQLESGRPGVVWTDGPNGPDAGVAA